MTALFSMDYNAGTPGAALTPANSGFDEVAGTDAFFSATNPADGSGCVSVSVVGGTSFQSVNLTATGTLWLTRYVMLPTTIGAPVTLMNWRTGGVTGTVVGSLRVTSFSELQLRDGIIAEITSGALAPNVWHRVSVRVTAGSATGHQLKIYASPVAYSSTATFDATGAATAVGATTVDRVTVGVLAAASFDYFYDRFYGDNATEPASPNTPATPTPASVHATVVIGRNLNATLSKTTVAGRASIPAATVVGGTTTVVAPATVQARATTTAVVTPVITSTLTPAKVQGVVTVGAPSTLGTASITVVLGVAALATATVPAPAVVAGTTTAVHPTTVAAGTVVGSTTVSLGAATAVTPATVNAATTVPLPAAILGSSSGVTVATVAALVRIGLPTIDTAPPLYIFRTPIRRPQGPRLTVDATPVQRGLMRHFDRGNGTPVAVLVTAGNVLEKNVVTADDQNAADYCFMGGRENLVTGSVAQTLLDYGYTLDLYSLPVGDTPPPPPPPPPPTGHGYGLGAYGTGAYGT